jgi:hypothetical protein
MKNSGATRGLYITFAVLSAMTLALLVLLTRSSAGLQPVRGVRPFTIAEPVATSAPDAGSSPTVP